MTRDIRTEIIENTENDKDSQAPENVPKTPEKPKRRHAKKMGILSYVFSSYERLEEKWEKSAVYGSLYYASISKPAERLRRVISRSAENSRILTAVSKFTSILPGVTLRAYGTFIFSLGLYSSLVYVIKTIASTLSSDIDSLVTGIMLMLMSLPLLSSGKTLAEAVLESRVGRFAAFEILGFSPEETAKKRTIHKRCDMAMLCGMIFGLSSFYIDIHTIVSALMFVAVGYFVLTRPEAGVIILFVAAAFLPTDILRIYILTLTAGYVYKLICGRRAFKLDLADAVMFVFASVFYLGGVVHYGAGGDTEVFYPSFVFVYFVIVNVIRDKKRRERTRSAVMTGGALIAAAFLLSRFFDIAAFFANYSFDSRVLVSVIDAFDGLAYELYSVMPYLAAVLPMMAAFVISRRETGDAFGMMLLSLMTAAAIIYTMSRGIWLGAVVGILVLLISRDFRFIFIPVGLGSAFVLSLFVLPDPALRFVFGLLDMSGADTVGRIAIRQNSARILLDNIVGGIGVHDGVFGAIYSTYSDFGMTAENTQSMPLGIAVTLGITGFLIFTAAIVLLLIKSFSGAYTRKSVDRSMASTAAFAGLLSVLSVSLTFDIFHDEKMMLMFFMFAAFTSAYSAVGYDRMQGISNTSASDPKTATADICFD